MMGNWNKCLLLAKGKYVAYLHDDDLLKDNYIHEITKIILDDRYKDAGAFSLNRDFIRLNRLPIIWPILRKVKHSLFFILNTLIHLPLCFRYLYRKNVTQIEPYMCLELRKNLYSNPSYGCVFNREELIADGGWSEEYYPSADYYTSLRFNLTHKVFRVRHKLGIYRFADNASLKIPAKEWKCVSLSLYKKGFGLHDERLRRFFAKWGNAWLFFVVSGLPENDVKELCNFFDLTITKPQALKYFLFKLRTRLFRLLHNLD